MPSPVSGMVVWLKDAGTVGQDGTAVANNAAVATWQDQSGHNNHFTNSSAGNRPTLITNGINGKPSVHFAAGSGGSLGQCLRNLTNFSSPCSVFLVARLWGSNHQRVLAAVNGNWLLGWWSGDMNSFYAEGWVDYPSTATDTQTHLYSAIQTGSNSSFFSNGTQLASNNSGVAGPNGLSVGGGYATTNTEYSDCDIAEVIVYSTALSSSDRQATELYLRSKWLAKTPITDDEDGDMIIQQSIDGQEIPFRFRDSSNNPVTGLTLSSITVTLWKPGNNGFGNTANTHPTREIGDGWYSYLSTSADVDTPGANILRAVSGSNDATQPFTIPAPAPLPAVPPNPSAP